MRYMARWSLLLEFCAQYVVLYAVHADDELPVANELLNIFFAAQCCIVDGGRQSHVRVRRWYIIVYPDLSGTMSCASPPAGRAFKAVLSEVLSRQVGRRTKRKTRVTSEIGKKNKI